LWCEREAGTLPHVVSRADTIKTASLAPLRHEDGRPIVPAGVIRGARSIAEAVFMHEDGPAPAERIDWLALELEDFLARSGANTRVVFRLSLLSVSILAPLAIGRVTSLGKLPLAERARALSRLEDRFGPPVLAVKGLLCVLYYEHPDAAREVGFDGSCLTGS
jgi:hypothetical protein